MQMASPTLTDHPLMRGSAGPCIRSDTYERSERRRELSELVNIVMNTHWIMV